jgi:carboxyl-terminal processing protease
MAYGPIPRRSRVPLPRLSLVFAVISFGLVFVSGYLYGQSDAVRGRHAFSPALRMIGIEPTQIGLFGTMPASLELSDGDRQRLAAFWETWSYVDKDFFPRESVNHTRMMYGAIRGMLESLNDPNTVFLTPASREAADAELRGSFDGVGIQVDVRDGQLRVTAPIDGSPAEQAGIRPGDVIVRVDDRDIRGLTSGDVVPLIRGPRGTAVTLMINREGSPEPLSFTLIRAEIRLSAVRARMLHPQVAYLRISSFNRGVSNEVNARLADLMIQQPAGLVLDLRSNPGGFVSSAVDTTSQFLRDGVIFYQRGADGEDQEFRPTTTTGQAADVPIVVLVNRGTASASEIMAAALRDNGRAVLLGEKTFGKGTVQSVRQLSDRSGLRLTSAHWLTPNQVPIHGEGLLPDIPVDAPLTPSVESDAAVEAALHYLLQTHASTGVATAAP